MRRLPRGVSDLYGEDMIKKIFVILSLCIISGCHLAPVATVLVSNSSDEVISDIDLFSNGKKFFIRSSLGPDESFSARHITVHDKRLIIAFSRNGTVERRDIGYIPAYSRGHCDVTITNGAFSRACRVG